jgi:hypothetical protein
VSPPLVYPFGPPVQANTPAIPPGLDEGPSTPRAQGAAWSPKPGPEGSSPSLGATSRVSRRMRLLVLPAVVAAVVLG